MSKIAVVTGGSGAIGAACCVSLAKNGFKVVVGYLSGGDRAEAVCASVGKENSVAVRADISDKKQAQKLIDTALDRFGGIDVLVNNAAVSSSGLFQYVTEEELDRIIGVNVKGAFYTAQAAAKEMISVHCGSIINISSMWGECGASAEAAYSMTKAALIGLTKALAKELGPSQIRVNCICPGLIDTPMNAAYTSSELSAIVDDTPLCRIGKPSDIASAVAFLSGGGASFITGQIIGVNGGYVI